jgi:hypothetical protein
MNRLAAGMRRALRAMRIVARDGRIPRWLRVALGIGLLPIPGPVDELVLLVAAPLAWLLYRGPLREAWVSAGTSR